MATWTFTRRGREVWQCEAAGLIPAVDLASGHNPPVGDAMVESSDESDVSQTFPLMATIGTRAYRFRAGIGPPGYEGGVGVVMFRAMAADERDAVAAFLRSEHVELGWKPRLTLPNWITASVYLLC